MNNKLSINLKRIVSYMLALLMIFSNFTFSPTVRAVGATLTIGSQSASNGATTNVPLNASNFVDVLGMDFNIQYDNTLLTYTGNTQVALSGNGILHINNIDNQILINWLGTSSLNLDSSTLLELNFTVISAATTNANLTFIGTKEISDSFGNPIVSAVFVDGTIALNSDETAPEITTYTLQVSGEEKTEVNNVIFSPNNDGIKDSVSIDLAFSEKVDYEINIKNGESTVKSWSGQATNPNAKIWNGEGGVGDGIYTIEVIITDEAGDSVTDTSKTITLDTTPPIITRNNEALVEIIVDNEYEDAGATATDNIDGDITADIVVVDPVNVHTVGTYIVTYNVSDAAGNPAIEVTRTVNITVPEAELDTIPPVIAESSDITTEATSAIGAAVSYVLPEVTDNIDNNLVTSCAPNPGSIFPLGSTIVECNAVDLSGNEASPIKFTVKVQDTTPPVITLNGPTTINLILNNTFTDPGATAIDIVDGLLIPTIGGDEVDTSAQGIYIVTYNISDAAGNPAIQATRAITVIVLLANQIILDSSTTLNASSTEVVIDSSIANNSIITVPENISNATLNISMLKTGNSATIPANINVNASTSSGNINLTIPSGTTIVAQNDSGWTGIVNLPQVRLDSLISPTPDSGMTASVASTIEIGFGDIALSFDNAVRISFLGQANKLVGWSRSGSFKKIIDICSADTQITGNALAADGNCKLDVGSDLVVWTKHFTTFITYTQILIPAPPALLGGGGVLLTVLTGDINGDDRVDKYDFSLMMANWDKTGINNSDLNNDEKVDKYDLALLMSRWSS